MPETCVILLFNPLNQLALRQAATVTLPFVAEAQAAAEQLLAKNFPGHTTPKEYFAIQTPDGVLRVAFSQSSDAPADPALSFYAIETLEKIARQNPEHLDPRLPQILRDITPHLTAIPYLHLGDSDFIYRFRPEKERNAAIYANDPVAANLYQSRLCAAIKALARRNERTAGNPVELDFGPVSYVLPSHFGFCLGVKNAIERAYETLAANPGRRVFMLSELIHNPFVNADLIRRGLRYLQTDKGDPLTTAGQKSTGAENETLLWDTLTPDDIVIIPAFGATDEDKRVLIRKGLAVCQYDATCMLVEKVWKAARNYGQSGYTVVIHGKHEHEETKATFSNTQRHAPAIIVRNLDEARQLAAIILDDNPAERRANFGQKFAGRHTPGFDTEKHLNYLAVVNQTTLLVNETRAIIRTLAEVLRQKFPEDQNVAANVSSQASSTYPTSPNPRLPRIGSTETNDTLCYATQVNQDALARALENPLDAAFVIGGKNSSNTYQLHRLCAEKLGDRAYFIQNETQIRNIAESEHYIFPTNGDHSHGQTIQKPLWPELQKIIAANPGKLPSDFPKKRVLITGGASCPDGIIQQIITRINALFPQSYLRSPETILAELEQ